MGTLNSKNKTYKTKSLLGIESTNSILNVKENHASYMRNLLHSDGILKKRHGWKEVYRFFDDFEGDLKVNGIYVYKNKKIFHAGNYLYEENERIENCVLPNAKSYGFESGGLLYIVCYENLYVFDGTLLTDIYDSQYSYVPITMKDISPVNKESTSVLCESGNLTTSKRKNTLIGVKETNTKYTLDGKVDKEKPLKVTTKMRVQYGSTEDNVAPYNAIYNEAKRLNTDNMAGIMGISNVVAENLFSGAGVDVNLSVIDEIDIFLKSPIKITEAVFYARGSTGVPRMAFLCDGDEVYDTSAVSEESVLDLTSVLKDEVIDEIRFYGNYSIGIIDEVCIFGKERYEGYVEIVHFASNFEFGKSISPTSVTDISGNAVSLSQNVKGTFSAGCTLYVEEGLNGNYTVCFNFINVSDSQTCNNVCVEYSVKDGEKLKCKIGEVCKTDTGKDILVLSDGKNLYLSSNKQGFSYLPENLKTEFDEITSLCAKEGMILGVFSKNNSSSVDISTKDGETSYALKGHSLQGGAINHSSSKTVNGDILSLSRDGIFGSVGNETHRTRRGENVKLLIPENIDNAVSVNHNGCYWLFVDGKVFVADTRFKIYENNRLDSSFEYEWWYLDGIDASCASEIDGEIYIGRDDGRIVKFYDGYSDVYYQLLGKGSYLFDENSDGVSAIYIDKNVGIKTYDTVLVSDCYSILGEIESKSPYGEATRLDIAISDFWTDDGNMKIYPDMEIYLKNQDGILTKAKCLETDCYTHSITVDVGENTDTYLEVLLKNENEAYKVIAEEDHYVLLDKYGSYGKFTDTENATLLWEIRTPVTAEYESAPLLKDEECKYLYGINVDLSRESGGVVTLEYETDKMKRQANLEYDENFDFNSFDFYGLSFNSSLVKSHSIRTFERNPQYIILKIKHSGDSDFGLKGYSVKCG